MVGGLKGWHQGTHFKQKAPQGPNVTLLIVPHLIDHLRAHVKGGAHIGVCKLGLTRQLLGQAKVPYLLTWGRGLSGETEACKDELSEMGARITPRTNLDVLACIQENVPRLEVPMKDGFEFGRGPPTCCCCCCSVLVPMALLEGRADLRKDLPYRVLLYGPVLALGLFYHRTQVTPLTVLHHYVQLGCSLVDNAVIVADNVGVAELPQNVHLCVSGWIGG